MDKKNLELRQLFCGVDELIPIKNGEYIKPINFDNGATTPSFKLVLKYINEFMPLYGAIGRSDGYKSNFSTKIYNLSRDIVLNFFNVTNKEDYDVIYVKNTTEGINMLSNILVDKDDIVITTRMEHHSNDLPWRKNCKTMYVDVLDNGRLDIECIKNIFKCHGDKVKLVAITGASNVTGFINDIYYLARLSHYYNARILVDGAQLVPHKEIFLEGYGKNDYIDFLVFSAHKMYAPFGIGAIVGRHEYLQEYKPDYVGGGQVKLVTDNKVIYKNSPDRFEAGTQNLMGVLALMASIKMIRQIGFDNIEQHENILTYNLLNGLTSIPRIELYGECTTENRLGIVVFNLEDVHHEEVGRILAQKGISVRTGCFCAQPYAKRLLKVSDEKEKYHILHPDEIKEGMVRVSLGLYNSLDEVNKFLNIIEYLSRYVYS